MTHAPAGHLKPAGARSELPDTKGAPVPTPYRVQVSVADRRKTGLSLAVESVQAPVNAEDPDNCAAPQPARAPTHTARVVIAYARAQLGKPYLWGGTGPDAYDCSGLTMTAYRAAGITIPRTSAAQYHHGPPVPNGHERPGDLVDFTGSDGTTLDPGHVGIVTKPGTMIDAPTRAPSSVSIPTDTDPTSSASPDPRTTADDGQTQFHMIVCPVVEGCATSTS